MIRPIQYLRGIAALSVVWLHSLTMMDGFTEVLGQPRLGGGGVDVFFVISGFIMLLTTSARPMTGWQFFCLRVVRVVPLYWLATLLMVGCALLGAFKKLQFSGWSVIQSLLFIPYGHEPVLVPGWTLNYEMFFYGLFALSLALPPRMRFSSLIATMLTLAAVGALFRISTPLAQAYTSSILLEFLAGSIIAYLWLNGKSALSLTASIAAMALGAGLLFEQQGLAGAILLVAGCLHPAIQSIRSPLLLALGDASYSVYLTHLFVLAALRISWLWFSPHTTIISAAAFMAAALIGSSIAGWLCYRYIEKPMTSRLHKALLGDRLGDRQPAAASPS